MKVRRRLLHWRPRWRGPRFDPGAPDVDAGGGGGGGGFSFLDLLDDLFAAVLVAIAVAVVLVTVVPALVLALEVLLVGLIAAIGFLGRAALGRPWTVEAVDTATRTVVGTWEVRGFRRAGALASAIQERVDTGGGLPTYAEIAGFVDRDGDAAWPIA